MTKALIKKISLILTAALLMVAISAGFSSVSADEQDRVRVTVQNNVFSVDSGAKWDGVLVDEWVDIDSESTMQSLILSALNIYGYSQTGVDSGYITEINGLNASDAGYMGGWMCTLNDWFTSEAITAYSVENGNLENGDEICVVFSNAWGADIGSDWSDTTTTLSSVSFSAGTLDKEFDSEVTDYTLLLPANEKSFTVNPTAFNKNYQVRTYLNDYAPEESGLKRSKEVSVEDGDKIIIGVGDKSWPTMNTPTEGTVYSFTVELVYTLGDVNLDGTVSILDVTLIQKYLANIEELSEQQLELANANGDETISILDATKIQKILAGIND